MSLAISDTAYQVDGARLAARWLRPAVPRRGTLVFLHEGLGSIAQWKDFPARLCQATGCAGFIYERRGFGGSDPLDGPRPLDYLDRESHLVLPGILAAAGIADPVLVGHSDGGTIALLYAAFHPRGPLAALTMAAHVIVEPETLAGIRQAREAFHNTDLPARLARYHGEKTAATFGGWADTWLQPAFAHWQMVDRLASIACPVLAAQGEGDEYGTAEQVDLIVRHSGGPTTGWMIPNCGHAPHLQAGDAVLDRFAGFVLDHT